jgi:outer membrane protein assembly factor BamE
MHALYPRLFLLFQLLLLSGCSYLPPFPYKIDIQQGNIVDEEIVSKLKPGMTRSQVRFALGTPLVTDVFRNNRWDYVYRLAPKGKIAEARQLTVFFEGDRLTRIEGDFPQPPAFKESFSIIPVSDEGFGPATNQGEAAQEEPDSSREIDFMKENQLQFNKGDQ